MNKKVLIVDNDLNYLDAIARFFEMKGYIVSRAVSLERAKQLLDYTWIHIVLIDIRMRNDNDDKDVSGLQFAKDPLYHSVPKIMLTRYPSYEHVREALGPNLDGLPPAVDFVNKRDGTESILRALEQTFEQRVRLNRHLTITWNQPLTFPYLVNLIQSEQDNERLLDRASELEDLFRKLFYDSSQITIGRVLKHRTGWLLLEVFAYGEAGNERQFVVSCGKKAQIVDEDRRYDEVVPHGAGVGSTIKQPGAETLRFAATPYILVGGDLEDMISFREYYHSRPAEAVAASLNNLYSATLPPWYHRGREQQQSINLSELYCRGLSLDDTLLAPEALGQRIEAISQQILAAGLVSSIDISADEITLRFANGEPFTCANPVAERYDERINPGAPALSGVVHGSIDPNSILVNAVGQTWLIDFTQARRG
jgi:ActR/RegA family two-component response regulator